jgi:lysozyme family protein
VDVEEVEGEMNFDLAFDRLMGHEGGYVNHPRDPGGETMWGVTKRVAMENGYFGDMRSLPRDTAKRIAKAAYWGRIQADQYDGAIAYQVMDAAFNHGIENAARFLQRAVGVADDGDIGPRTIAAIKARTVTDVLALFNAERLAFYTKLSTWPEFGKGWAMRIVGNLKYQAEDA